MDLAKNLKIDSVSRLHPAAPLVVPPTHSVAEAVEAMRRQSVGCVLVCEGERIRGIFTERDLLRRVLAVGKPLSTPVGLCMTPDPVTVHRKESIASAVRRMTEGGYRHLPVVDESGRWSAFCPSNASCIISSSIFLDDLQPASARPGGDSPTVRSA